jgi:hypothetical protein
MRDRQARYGELIEKALNGFGQDEQARSFIEHILALKPRYTRDQMSIIIHLQDTYAQDELIRAVSYCMERELFTASDFKDTLEYFSVKQERSLVSAIRLPLKYSIVTAEKRQIDAYASLSTPLNVKATGGEAI